VLTVLEEIFTPAETTLVGADKAEHVQATRDAFQEAVADEFIGIVEETLGRTVRAFTSHVHIGEELAVEFFLLEDGELPGRESPATDGNRPAAGDGR
jgi:uncharacterized protein YbcI